MSALEELQSRNLGYKGKSYNEINGGGFKFITRRIAESFTNYKNEKIYFTNHMSKFDNIIDEFIHKVKNKDNIKEISINDLPNDTIKIYEDNNYLLLILEHEKPFAIINCGFDLKNFYLDVNFENIRRIVKKI